MNCFGSSAKKFKSSLKIASIFYFRYSLRLFFSITYSRIGSIPRLLNHIWPTMAAKLLGGLFVNFLKVKLGLLIELSTRLFTFVVR